MTAANAAASCQGKLGYATFKDAEKVAKRMRKNKHAMLSAYRCPICDLYHVGSTIVPRHTTKAHEEPLPKRIDPRSIDAYTRD